MNSDFFSSSSSTFHRIKYAVNIRNNIIKKRKKARGNLPPRQPLDLALDFEL